MTAFRFEAADAQGRMQRGVVDADSARLARATLRQRGLTPLAVDALGDQASAAAGGDAATAQRRAWRSRLPAYERALVLRQLANLVVAGLPLAQALLAVQEQAERAGVRDLLAAIRSDVLSGTPLASALARHPREFPELDRALVSAGEQSGDLGEVLTRLADHVERRDVLAQKVRLAFAYPAIVTLIALIVVTGLLTYVVPQIVGVFTQSHQKLPWLTVALIALSNFLRHDGWTLIVALIIAVVAIRSALARPAVRLRWHARVLQMPLAGPLVRRSNVARFADTLAILGGAGVPILRALEAARDTMGNLVLRDQVDTAISRVREGAPLSKALAGPRGSSGAFPPVLLNLIASGEATGRLPEMLERAAKGQADELERRTLLLTSLLEPLLVVAMGVVVLIIVLAILLPIIELNQLIR